jgi:hypothetical protein
MQDVVFHECRRHLGKFANKFAFSLDLHYICGLKSEKMAG